jgi:hypothetical protein
MRCQPAEADTSRSHLEPRTGTAPRRRHTLAHDRMRPSPAQRPAIGSATRRSRRSVRLAPCRTIGIVRAVCVGAGVAAFVRQQSRLRATTGPSSWPLSTGGVTRPAPMTWLHTARTGHLRHERHVPPIAALQRCRRPSRGGRFSGLVLAADRVAASNLGHLGSAQTALPGAASSCPVPPTDQVSRVGSAVPEGQFVVVGRQVIARSTGTSVTRCRRGYTRVVRVLG